jgi:outer membrane receptor protein involved in Fe transport
MIAERMSRGLRDVGAAGTLVIAACVAGVANGAAAPPAETPASPGSTLAPIVVTGERLREQVLVDRKIYSISADLQSTTGSVADVLSAIPSIEIDADGVVALRGDTSVLILVDGRPLAQLSGPLAGDSLQQIPASDIDRIEVMTNPPPQFKAEGAAGVINIITRKTRRAGVSGTVNASVGNRSRYVLGTSTSYNSGGLHLSGSASLRQDDRQRQISSDLAVPDPAAHDVALGHNALDEHVRRLIPLIKLGADYSFNDHQSLSLSVGGGERRGDRSYIQHAENSLSTGAVTSVSERDSRGTERSTNSDQRLVFEQKLQRPDEVLSFTLHRTTFHENEHYDYTNFYTLPPASPSYDDLNLRVDQVTTEFGTDYVLPFSRTRNLKLGYDFQQDDDGYGNAGDNVDPVTGARIVNPSITNNFRYLQQIDAAYATYEAMAGVWTWLGGIRVERTRTDARLLTDNTTTDRRDVRVYPSLHLDRALSDEATLSMSASRRVTHPDPNALNPYIDRQDAQNLKAGNPNLLPQDTQSYELGYSVAGHGLSYEITGYYRRNRDRITDVTQVLGNDVLLTTKANLPKSDSGGLELIGNGRLGAKITYGLSGNLFYNQIDATALGAQGQKSTAGFNAKVNLDYRPTSADLFQVAFTRSDKRLTPQGYIAAINLVNLGYRRQLVPDLAAVLTVSDVFNGQTYRRYVDTAALSNVYQRHQIGRVIYVGLLYSYGSKKKSEDIDFETDQEQ